MTAWRFRASPPNLRWSLTPNSLFPHNNCTFRSGFPPRFAGFCLQASVFGLPSAAYPPDDHPGLAPSSGASPPSLPKRACLPVRLVYSRRRGRARHEAGGSQSLASSSRSPPLSVRGLRRSARLSAKSGGFRSSSRRG
ncbi:hypothetical protein GUJ93_ZPchr0013g37225 [Zizania palustris]|uniref:Uncharacterized protein n=1 Tax=Zizania palustris TaxID=103762 RepID=A0A8J5X1Z4_ZIZPA|nr:hypothetical protein GUJ93_ZPchr0013g37225 [Zizania palustris]